MKKYGSLISVLFICACSVLDIEAQSAYLEPGTSAFGFGAGLSTADSGIGFDLALSYSIEGMADLGFFVGRFSGDEDDLGVEINQTLFGPGFTFYMARQSENVPFSVSFSGAYGVVRFGGDDLEAVLDNFGLKMKGRSLGGGLNVSRRIALDQSGYFIPSFGISHTSGKVTLENQYGDSESNSEGITSFSVSLGMLFETEDASSMYVQPSISLNENETTFGVTIGFLLSDGSSPSRRSTFYKPPSQSSAPPQSQPIYRNERTETRPYVEKSTVSKEPEKEVTISKYETFTDGDLQQVRANTRALTQAQRTDLDPAQIQAISRVFKVSGESIVTFRWGNSAAPAGHPHYKSTFYVIEYGDDSYKARETLRVNPFGEVLERKKE